MAEQVEDTAQDTIEIVVVSSAACNFCVEAIRVLEELRDEFPLRIRIVDIRSEEGAAIEREHRPPAPPFVLVDGDMFSFGRLPRKKLHRLLSQKTLPEEGG